jgi:hypothetical protein
MRAQNIVQISMCLLSAVVGVGARRAAGLDLFF